LKLWTPAVDTFLAGVGLPSANLYPQYLPTVPPPPSHFAAIDDAAAVPHLNDAGRALYRKFLAMPLPRAFVLASGFTGSDTMTVEETTVDHQTHVFHSELTVG
jgi:hypothetical protein